VLRRAGAWLLGAIALASGCSKGDDSNRYVPPPPPVVVVATPVVRDVVHYQTFTGVVEASETVELRARVQGFLESVQFRPGQRVRQGDILFQIDARQYAAAVEQATATIRAQQAALAGAESDAQMARELADQRAGPEIDAVIKAARRDAMVAELARAEAMLRQAQLDLEYCTIRAPIDGRITRNLVDVGNLVGRAEPTHLATIVRQTPCYVPLDINEAEVLDIRRLLTTRDASLGLEPGQIAPGEWMPCELALSDQEELSVIGRIDYVDPEINRETGTLRVRTRFENENELLLPGMFARVRFAMSSQEAMLVPDAAVLSDQQGRYLMVVNVRDEVEVRRVSVGRTDGPMRIITDGIAPTDRVIVLGVLKARPGSPVTPQMQQSGPEGR
jgi:RND family efflux transporter MFP subunit